MHGILLFADWSWKSVDWTLSMRWVDGRLSVSDPALYLSQWSISSNLLSLICFYSLLRISIGVAWSKRSHNLISLTLLLPLILQADIVAISGSPFWNLIELADVHELLWTFHVDLKAAAHLGSLCSALDAARNQLATLSANVMLMWLPNIVVQQASWLVNRMHAGNANLLLAWPHWISDRACSPWLLHWCQFIF